MSFWFQSGYFEQSCGTESSSITCSSCQTAHRLTGTPKKIETRTELRSKWNWALLQLVFVALN